MSEQEPNPPEFHAETPPPVEEEQLQDPQGEESKPTSFDDDPDYQGLKDALEQQWLAQAGVPPLSGEHQDYLYGNPADPKAATLEQDTERAFREQFPDRAAAYDAHERVKAYEKIGDDPAYKAVQDQITVRTNADSPVRGAFASGGDWGDSWDRAHMREHIHGMNDFARQYPEKTAAYAQRWDVYVEQHPELADMNNAEWQAWCSKHPGAFAAMSEYRNIARAVDHVKRRAEMDRIQPDVRLSERRLSEIRTDLGIDPPESDADEMTALNRQKERLSQLQLEDVAASIRANIPPDLQSANRETLHAMQKELADLPYFPGNDAHELLDADGEDEGVMMVDTDAIVGSVSLAFQNWSSEYEGRAGRVVDISQELMTGTPEAVDHVFHVTNPEQGVKLKKISAPGGDLFFVIDGSHRVAGSKLAQLPELPAQVENMTELSEVRTTDPMLKSQWEQRINRGLIQGSVEETTTPSGQKSFALKIESQALPWMSLPQSKLVNMTKFYFDRYPGALDNITSFTSGKKIPKEALLDEVAMNYYLMDRWGEYKPTT